MEVRVREALALKGVGSEYEHLVLDLHEILVEWDNIEIVLVHASHHAVVDSHGLHDSKERANLFFGHVLVLEDVPVIVRKRHQPLGFESKVNTKRVHTRKNALKNAL